MGLQKTSLTIGRGVFELVRTLGAFLRMQPSRADQYPPPSLKPGRTNWRWCGQTQSSHPCGLDVFVGRDRMCDFGPSPRSRNPYILERPSRPGHGDVRGGDHQASIPHGTVWGQGAAPCFVGPQNQIAETLLPLEASRICSSHVSRPIPPSPTTHLSGMPHWF